MWTTGVLLVLTHCHMILIDIICKISWTSSPHFSGNPSGIVPMPSCAPSAHHRDKKGREGQPLISNAKKWWPCYDKNPFKNIKIYTNHIYELIKSVHVKGKLWEEIGGMTWKNHASLLISDPCFDMFDHGSYGIPWSIRSVDSAPSSSNLPNFEQ